MEISPPRHRLFAVTLATFAGLGAVNSAQAYDVYHGVNANNGAVIWTNASFGVSGLNPNLSFYHFDGDNEARHDPKVGAFACIVKVVLPDGQAAGDTHALGDGNTDIIATFRGRFPWVMTFDDAPPGHWSIVKSEIMDVSNATAGTVSAIGFKTLAGTANSGVTVINGTSQNCVR